jgi:hypothetical protein
MIFPIAYGDLGDARLPTQRLAGQSDEGQYTLRDYPAKIAKIMPSSQGFSVSFHAAPRVHHDYGRCCRGPV